MFLFYFESDQGGYSFPITWFTTQTDLTTGALSLGGFKVEQEHCYPSFTAVLGNISPTGAVIEFTPLGNHTHTILMQFEVLVARSSCTDQLEVVSESILSLSEPSIPRCSTAHPEMQVRCTRPSTSPPPSSRYKTHRTTTLRPTCKTLPSTCHPTSGYRSG